MKLYVNGQDIAKIIVGSVDDGMLVTHEVETEGFLEAIHTFVREQGEGYNNLEGIYVVVGPGSATALRSSLTIVQTIHFVEGTPLFAIEKMPEASDQDTIKQAIEHGELVDTLTPIYQHSPRITISKKDALGRAANSITP